MTDTEVVEEEFNKQKYLPKYSEVNSISDYLDDGIVIYKDYDQLLLSNNDILDQIFEYKSEKDIDFKGKYMFDFNDIDPKNKTIVEKEFSSLTKKLSFEDKEKTLSIIKLVLDK